MVLSPRSLRPPAVLLADFQRARGAAPGGRRAAGGGRGAAAVGVGGGRERAEKGSAAKKRQRGVRSPRSALGSPLAWPRSAGTRHCRREEFASVSLGGAREVRRAAPRPQQSKRERRPRGNPRAPLRRGARGRRRSHTRGPARTTVGAVGDVGPRAGRREETHGAAPLRWAGGRSGPVPAQVQPAGRQACGCGPRPLFCPLRRRAAPHHPAETGGRCCASG